MANYAGVTLSLLHPGSWAARWSQEALIAERPVPYANYADLQSAGRSNFRLEAMALISADADVATLQAAVGVTLRTLTNPFNNGVNYSNVALIGVGIPERIVGQARWRVPLAFVRKD